MTIEPLRRDVRDVRDIPSRRVPGVTSLPTSRRVPPATTARHPMCVVVTQIAEGEGDTLVRALRRRGAHRVVVLARRAGREELRTLLAGGLRGGVASTTDSAASTPRPAPTPVAPTAELSARELSVLSRVAAGRTNRLIGEELGLSALTVKSHLARISRKLGTGDRAELVAISIRNGFID
ncbi:helix-turn-helix transcriptional regulator [Cellulomonas sp. S1-8]|uniref:helix-turn-helix transcriptional regulator n=1 Tax=Cellulomonas sp. S1-8 TaxID=2904790 RepID=UPI00224436ED|nr:LuxR C-terminal-related transcriptional regulator [Cellulomonas sp. S1-8]UZN05068.1 LuxR C-terminal-related transcriptional regulator [Cellulomonas sp. S1-8]